MKCRLPLYLCISACALLSAAPSHANPPNGLELANLDRFDPLHQADGLPFVHVPSTVDVSTPKQQPKKSKSAPAADFPNWRQNLTVENIAKLSDYNAYYLAAAMRTQSKLKQRSLQILDYYFVDVNHDETVEIAALSQSKDESGRVVQFLSIYDFDDDLSPMLRYEKKHAAKDNAQMRQYTQAIQPLEEGMRLCEDWRIASWTIHECNDILFDENWSPVVMRNQVQTAEPKAHSSQSNVFDFRARMASRNYERLPEGPFMPPLRRSVSYAMLFAEYDASLLPEPQSIETSQTAGFSDTNHTPIQYGMRWNAQGLYITLQFKDADKMTSSACHDQLSIQQVDHAEIWFDLNPTLEIKRDSPQSWQIEYEKNYQNEPYRHYIDDDIFGLAVTPDGCVVPMTPSRSHWTDMPQIKAIPQDEGYRIDMFIPSRFYRTSDMKQFKRALGIGFTARQHDIHESGFDSVATSEWQWPDPFTFGQIWLLPGGDYHAPTFPMQWETWLIDN